MTDSVVAEGYARLRDGKKWKTRWLVLRKPSPVADCLVLLVFKDKSNKAQGNKERAGVTLEEICGLETGQWYEGVAFTLTILCLNQVAVLGFDTREALQAWEARLRYSLGEVHRFNVGVLPGTKLESGPATLHLCNNLLSLARDVPPVIIGHWNLPDLRRYGPVPNGFVFEGGTRCGYWAGVFLLSSAESEQISFLFDCIVRGISPTRGPFGIRPVLPDPSASQAILEQRLNHETQELEKRLSMLSHRSSKVSSIYGPSAGGDDRSMSGSSDTSDTSQSDCSIGSRLAIWSEPVFNVCENIVHVGPKVALQSVEKLSANQGGGNCLAAQTPRQLQEIGRQSSSDSGIATSSHSSYSGSFSSYTGSLDITPGDDFGSVFSLPPHVVQDLSPCSCAVVSGHEYQVPTSLRYLYDSPRSMLQETNEDAQDSEHSTLTKDTPSHSSAQSESSKGNKESTTRFKGHLETNERESSRELSHGPLEENKKSKTVPSSEGLHPDTFHICSSFSSVSKTIVMICSVCGGFKGTPYIPASSAVGPAIPGIKMRPRISLPEHHISNPADQSVQKSPCRTNIGSDYSVAVKSVLAKSRTTPGSINTSEKICEELPAPKKGRVKLANLLAELLRYPRGDKEAEGNSCRLYESMSPALGNGPKHVKAAVPLQNSQEDARTAIYENCLKCQGSHCPPPLRVIPADMYHNRNISFIPAMHLKRSQEPEGANGELQCEADGCGSQSTDSRCQYEEMNGQTGGREDKRLNSKEERRRADPAYEIMESGAPERNSEVEEKSKYELMVSCGQQKFPQETEGTGAIIVFPPEVQLPERPRSEGATYVNIPVSPTSKKQLNYMELELQEPGSRGIVAPLQAQRKSSTKYAQIDITATETAHKVGSQHALDRQEGLHTLEPRKKMPPN